MNRPKTISLSERLWRRVLTMPSGCWEWQGGLDGNGYGQIGRGRKGEGLVSTHRAAWEVTHGTIPDGMFVCHHCDNILCCNPSHLFLGTPADNVADMMRKGRGARGMALPQTRLSDDDIAEMRRLREAGLRQREIAERFGATQGYVSTVLSGKYRAVS